MEKINQKLNRLFFSCFKIIPLLTAGLILFFSDFAQASAVIISDEETESYLQNLLQPIYSAAGVSFNRNKIFILSDNSLNAFVSDGNDLFIHSETILQAKSDDEIRGVLAHEVGHIQGGHILRHKLRIQEMQNLSLASMVAAVALGTASGRGDVAAAIALGSHSSLLNQSLSYQIQEERSADEAAVSLLKKTHHSPKGLLEFMKKIQTQNKLQGIQENPYFRTHPMSAERLAFLQQAVTQSSYPPEKSKSNALKRIQAKLYAFIKTPQQTAYKYPISDTSIEAYYARAIAAFKSLNFNKALRLTEHLMQQDSNNPHFHELKGQILFEAGRIKESQKEFLRAIQIFPKSALFKIDAAQATLELSPSAKELQSTIIHLQQVLTSRPSSIAWLLLAKAYHLAGKDTDAKYASAQYSLHTGDIDLAQKQAEDAQKNCTQPQLRLKIEDLLNLIKDIKKS